VWAQRVVLLDPGVDQHARFEQAVELFAVQEPISHRAVEALDERVLLRAALLDERCGDAVLASQ
jgi:hypothetical protein